MKNEATEWAAAEKARMIREAQISAYMAVNGARDYSYERAVTAARWAFRAEPGLRGE